jgi:hypothetical protein
MTNPGVPVVQALRGKGREIDALLADPIRIPASPLGFEGLEVAA